MIPEDWEVKELGDLVTVRSGKRLPKGKTLVEYKTKHPYIRVRDLSNGTVKVLEVLYIDDETCKSISKYIINKDDVYISIVGTIGLVGTIPKELDNANLTENCARLTNIKGTTKEWISYFLNMKTGQEQIASLTVGTTQGKLALYRIKKIKISLPPLPEQQSITKILSDLDSKIELNQQMNKTLEAIGQAIFKHWFIDFEFPNEKGKPYKSSGGEMVNSELGEIPKGWRVGKLGDFVNVIKGVSYKSEELKDSDKALVTLKSIDRGGGLNKNGFKEFIGKYKKEQEIIDGDIVVAHTDITQKAEVLGKPAIVRIIQKYKTLIASLDLSIVRPKDSIINKPYLYYLLKSENFQNHAFGYANGTTVLHLSSKAVPEYSFVAPDKKLILKFGESMEKVLDKKKISEAGTENLILVRDSLLPKLMSGKIRVPVGKEVRITA